MSHSLSVAEVKLETACNTHEGTCQTGSAAVQRGFWSAPNGGWAGSLSRPALPACLGVTGLQGTARVVGSSPQQRDLSSKRLWNLREGRPLRVGEDILTEWTGNLK